MKKKKPAKKISVNLDHSTAILLGSLAKKGVVTLKHDAKLGYGEAKLDMTDNPKDKKIVLRTNHNLAHAYGFPVATD